MLLKLARGYQQMRTPSVGFEIPLAENHWLVSLLQILHLLLTSTNFKGKWLRSTFWESLSLKTSNTRSFSLGIQSAHTLSKQGLLMCTAIPRSYQQSLDITVHICSVCGSALELKAIAKELPPKFKVYWYWPYKLLYNFHFLLTGEHGSTSD